MVSLPWWQQQVPWETQTLDLDDEALSDEQDLPRIDRPVRSDADYHDVFSTIYQTLQQFYYPSQGEPLEKDAMFERAFKGFVDALEDPYTVYLTAPENIEFTEDMQGSREFEGIGAVIQKRDEGIQIDEVIKWSPAFQAWLEPLDIILEIDGESTLPLDVHQAVQKIRGPAGSEVELTVWQQRTNEIVDLSIVRGKVNIPSVKVDILPLNEQETRFGLYVELAIFGDDTTRVLQQALRELEEEYPDQTYHGVIVDVRGNGGWYLPKAIEIASFFVPQGELITTARYRAYPDEAFVSQGYGLWEDVPIVVLTDRLSASASEIVAASLRDQRGATIVGTKTFGKWSIQSLHDLADGASLKITIGNRYTPLDESVTSVGLMPDREIEFDADGYVEGIDNQLLKAKEVLYEKLR